MSDLLWLAGSSLELAFHLWPVTLGICAVTACSFAWSMFRRPSRLREKGRSLLMVTLPPVAIVLFGWVFAATPAMGWTIYAGLVAAVLVTAWLVWRLAQLRWLAFCVGALGFWVSFSAAFVAGMSIADDWI